MKTRKAQLKNKIKGKLKAWVTAGSPSDNYGFGSNWTLNIGTKDKIKKKTKRSLIIRINLKHFGRNTLANWVKIKPYLNSKSK